MTMSRGALSSRWLVFALLGAACCATFCTAPNPDYPEPLDCTLGAWQCKGDGGSSTVAQVCGRDTWGELVFIDEACPTGARCETGRCVPAEGLPPCTRQSDCDSGKSCVPLVQGATLASFCVPNQSAAAAPGAACTDDRSCQSYHCLQQAQGRFCLLTCGSDNHCPRATPRCQPLNVTISGVRGMVGSCSPR